MIPPRARSVVAGVLLVASLGMSALPSDLARAVTEPGDYGERRAVAAFKRLDVDFVRATLDASLPRDTPVMIAPRVAGELDLRPERLGSTFWFPRLTEALYPRPVVVSAPHVLELLPDRVVVGPDVAPREPPPPLEDVHLRPLAFLLGMAGLVGLGLALRRFLAPDALVEPWAVVCAAFVRGAFTAGVVAMAATWTQVEAPTRAVGAVGLACAAAAVVIARRRGALVVARPGPALLATCGGALAVLAAAAAFPFALWDGRSIWLLHAKQLHLFGRIPAVDLARPELAFTHGEYPLSFPAVLAQATALAPVYDERMAAVAGPLFSIVCAGLAFAVLRRGATAVGAACVVGVVLLGGAHTALGVYADVVVALLLVGAAAGLRRDETAGVGWLCVACASCVKQEGLLFGAVVVVAWMLVRRAWPGRLALLVAPAILHALWARATSLPSDFAGMDVTAALAQLPSRLQSIAANVWLVASTGGYDHAHGPLWAAAVVLPATWALLAARRRLRSDAAVVAAISSALVAMIGGIFVVSPRALDWHVQTAADRLLLTPAALAVLALFLALNDDARAGGVVTPARAS